MCSPKKIRCFKCLEWFEKTEDSKPCTICGDFKCPNCGACMCDLSKDEKRVALAMIHTYENFIKEKLDLNYDFSKHKKIEEEII